MYIFKLVPLIINFYALMNKKVIMHLWPTEKVKIEM